jgi:hypothetical protein
MKKHILLMTVGALAVWGCVMAGVLYAHANDTGEAQRQIQADYSTPDGQTGSSRWKNRIFDNEGDCQSVVKTGHNPDGSADEAWVAALIELQKILPAGTTVKFSCVPLVQGNNSI